MSLRSPEEIAKQLQNYADAITAFALLQSISFLIALASNDFREGVLDLGRFYIQLIFLVAAMIYTFAVIACMIGEDNLLGRISRLEPIGKWTWNIRIFRLAIINIANLIASGATTLLFFPRYRMDSNSRAAALSQLAIAIILFVATVVGLHKLVKSAHS